MINKAAFTLLFLFQSFLFSADWPNWLGPTHDGISTESDFGNNLDNLQWKSKVGVGFSSMVVADGRLFTMGHDGPKRGGKETVYCLDAKNRKTLYGQILYEAPLVDYLHEGGRVPPQRWMAMRCIPSASTAFSMPMESSSGKSMVQGYDQSIGHEKSTEWGLAGSLYVMGNLLLIEAGATYALNKLTGEIVWKSQDYRPAYGSPISFKSGKRNPYRRSKD